MWPKGKPAFKKIIYSSGERVDRWTILEEDHIDTTRFTRYFCRCECGTVKSIKASKLKAGESRSCGCIRDEFLHNFRRRKPYEAIFNKLKNGAKERNIEMTLSFEDYVKFTTNPFCHYCDSSLVWLSRIPCKKIHPEAEIGVNLDRKDNSLGYTVDNCVPCCKRCNWAKGSWFSYEQFLKIGETIKTFEVRSDEN